MKKFISFVMAGAMVASLVPATAFAKGDVTATAKVVDALEKAKTWNGEITGTDVPELQLKITSTDYQISNSSATPEMDVTVTLDNADFGSTFDDKKNIGVRLDDPASSATEDAAQAALVLAQSAQTAAQTAYDNAVAAADVTAEVVTEQNAFNSAQLEDTNKGTELANAKTELTTAEGQLDTAKTNEATAKAEYVTESAKTVVDTVNDATTETTAADIAAKKAVWDEKADIVAAKQAVVDTKAATVATLTTEKAATAAALEQAETTLNDAKAAAAADVEAVQTAKLKLDEAKAAVAKAQQAVADAQTGVSSIIIKDFEKTDDDQIEFTIVGRLHKDDVVYVDLISDMDSKSEGKKATVSVDSKMVVANDLVYASVLGQGLKASVKKTVDIAEDEVQVLNSNGIKIESAVGDFKKDTEITLKLNNGFEFVQKSMGDADFASVEWVDDKEIKLVVKTDTEDTITLKGTQIEATTAKTGAVATITVKSKNMDSASVEVAKVVDYKVSLSVDEDEDVPVIYSGVNVANKGITDDSDHYSLEVTAKESFPGAWSMRQGFDFNLPEGVYVTDVDVVTADNFKITKYDASEKKNVTKNANKEDWKAAFFNAYQDGDHKNFEFDKRVFDDVNVELTKDPAELTFKLELVADPTFEGDVKLAFEGSLVEKQEVTIAKFVKPYTVKAEQNDVIIDYRNTEIKTPIVITEAEEGLWAKNSEFRFSFDKADIMDFEDDATFEIDKDSELDIKDTTSKGTLTFSVKEESDAAATVTIKDMKLFMSRNIPAGAYDLEIGSSLEDEYLMQRLFAADHDKLEGNTITVDKEEKYEKDHAKDCWVNDVCDYSEVVKEAFVNVVTGGRDQDNLFTTKVVVPVGESYMVAGENKVELDVAAYISEAGYTMLPVRAISKALGVNTNNVLWNADARTVTIMYGQRIITMTVGQKTIYVNGSAVPASAAPEIKDGRTFLPLRDLGTALGVTDVSWDAATKTATMNGGK